MKKNENGRSMVEMLGVLAIIGVLSVTGISGYTLAMRRYRANEIIQMAGILAIMAQSAESGEGACTELSKSGFPAKVGGLDINMVADPTPVVPPVNIHIEITGLSADETNALCDMVKKPTTLYAVEWCTSGEINDPISCNNIGA